MNVAREGWPFILPALALALAAAAWWLSSRGAFALGVVVLTTLLLGFVTYFFRDPDRRSDTDLSVVLSPADGRVLEIAVEEDPFFQGPARRITIFLSVFNVHVQRAPAAGTVTHRSFKSGQFLAAWDPKASVLNEQASTGFSTAHGRVLVRQITGLIARRIVTYPNEGDKVERGDRIGLIRFGSRVDLLVPLDWPVVSSVGDRVVGGLTPLVHTPDAHFEGSGARAQEIP